MHTLNLLSALLVVTTASPAPPMKNIGILISLADTRLPDASHTHLVHQSIDASTRSVSIYVSLEQVLLHAPHLASWKIVQRILSRLYLDASQRTYGIGLPFISVDGLCKLVYCSDLAGLVWICSVLLARCRVSAIHTRYCDPGNCINIPA